jgi:hypothetical protein
MGNTDVRFVIIDDPNSIFGSVGRCGSGYNTRWNDWSEQGIENIKNLNDEWYKRYDAITEHYTKLEESILKEGFRNPIILTCGRPFNRRQSFIPPELRQKKDLLIMEGFDGGSRLWVAQKYNIPVPCIINDRTGKYADYPELFKKEDILKYYKDPPEYINFSYKGVTCTKIKHSHLDNEFVDPEKQAEKIIPLWVELMKKYGYRPRVNKMHRKYIKRVYTPKLATEHLNKYNFRGKQPARLDEKGKPVIPLRIRTKDDIIDVRKEIEHANKKGIVINKKEEVKEPVIELGNYDDVDASDWDRTAYVVAGGPSLEGFDWDLLGKDKFVVAINQSHRVLPDAQIVYFTDRKYWRGNRESLLNHKGILIRGVLGSGNKEEKHHRIRFMHLTGSTGLEKTSGKLKHGSNSTYAVINMLAVHLNFNKIYLMGVDMRWAKKGKKDTTHWHEGYKAVTPESAYGRMIANFATLVTPLKDADVEVINLVNPKCPSKLKCFKTKELNEIFGE